MAEKFDRKLLRLIKENSFLYDTNHVKYIDCNAREVAWQKIGDELKRPAADCKLRWINIRDVYRRILRHSAMNNTPRKKQYKYENEISFLKPFLKEITPTYNNYDSDPLDNTGEDQESDDEPIQPKVEKKPKKKKKRDSALQDQQEQLTSGVSDSSLPNAELDPSDPIDSFLLSIGSTLKTFSPYHLNIAKSKLFSIVQEHELQQIVQKERPSNSHDIKISSSDNLHFM